MPPKAKAKSVAKAKAKSLPIAPPTVPTIGPNIDIMTEAQQLMAAIESNPFFEDLMEKAPLGVGEGGSTNTFDITAFTSALDKGGEYVATCNFRWLDWQFNTSPGVPVLRSSVMAFAESQYGSAKTKFDTCSIVVCIDNTRADPMAHKGGLRAATPQEELLAPIFALGQACVANSLANSDAQKWLQWFQTARFTFKLLPTKEAREFETIAIRQRAAHLYSMISYTPVQWVYKIIQMKKDRRF